MSFTLSKTKGSLYVESAKTSLNVTFQQVGGEEFASLMVAPSGAKPITQVILGSGNTIDFSGNAGTFRLTVTGLDLNDGILRVLIEKR